MKFFNRRDTARLYADAAAATPIHPRVQKRMIGLLDTYANPGALHKEALIAKGELQKAREEIAAAIKALPDEIIFTASGTEANNLALFGTLNPLLRKNKNTHAVTLCIEHQSVLEPLMHLKKYGLALTVLPVDENGLVSPKLLREAITSQTVLISIQLVNSEIGTLEPVREIAKEIRYARKMRMESGNTLPLLYHTDAAQAPLYTGVDVQKLGVDLMTLDAQKILGPKSVGILYMKRGVELEHLIIGGRQERGLRAGTENVVLAGAFAEALTMAQENMEERATKVKETRDFLAKEITARIPEVRINGTMEKRVANNLNISIPGLEGETAVIALDALGIAISTRSACVTRDEDPSHVILALGHSRQRAREAIRITLLPTATKVDATRITEALVHACELYRKKV